MRQKLRLTQSFETFAEASSRTEKNIDNINAGRKRKHNSAGNLFSYQWKHEDCLTEVKGYSAGQSINFTKLALKYEIKNIKGDAPKNGGQIVKKFLHEKGVDLTILCDPNGKSIEMDGTRVRRAKKRSVLVLRKQITLVVITSNYKEASQESAIIPLGKLYNKNTVIVESFIWTTKTYFGFRVTRNLNHI